MSESKTPTIDTGWEAFLNPSKINSHTRNLKGFKIMATESFRFQSKVPNRTEPPSKGEIDVKRRVR